jgi:hypothetical protein
MSYDSFSTIFSNSIIKKGQIRIEARIDMPVVDIIDDKHRLKAIEEGLVRSISKGLYEQKAYLLDK